MKHRFNEAQTRLLEANPNVKHASDRSISYEPEFKLRAVQVIFCRNAGHSRPSCFGWRTLCRSS